MAPAATSYCSTGHVEVRAEMLVNRGGCLDVVVGVLLFVVVVVVVAFRLGLPRWRFAERLNVQAGTSP